MLNMKLTLDYLDKELLDQIKNYILQRYKIELTDNWDDYVTCKQLRQHCSIHHLNYTEIKNLYNLQGTTIKRNNIKYRGFRGIKLVDNSPLEKESN